MNPDPHQARAFFGRRKGHKLRPHHARLIESLLPRLTIDLSRPAPGDLAALFAVAVDDIQLEIGFGGGEFMIAQAQAHPQKGFIGVEPFVNGMAKALAAIEKQDLQNVRLHFDDATDLIAWLPQGALARIDLIHPDPWPKRRHWKRRFIQDAMVERLLRSPDFEWTAQCADDWRKPWPDFIQTRYHTKAAREQRTSCFLIFRRV
jgi:tRNA (guanine-N7-)-methyltransferase